MVKNLSEEEYDVHLNKLITLYIPEMHEEHDPDLFSFAGILEEDQQTGQAQETSRQVAQGSQGPTNQDPAMQLAQGSSGNAQGELEQFNQGSSKQFNRRPSGQFNQGPSDMFDQGLPVVVNQEPLRHFDEKTLVKYIQRPVEQFNQGSSSQFNQGLPVQVNQGLPVQVNQGLPVQVNQEPLRHFDEKTPVKYIQRPVEQFNQGSSRQFDQRLPVHVNQEPLRHFDENTLVKYIQRPMEQFNQGPSGYFDQKAPVQFNQGPPGQFAQRSAGPFNHVPQGKFSQGSFGQFEQGPPGQLMHKSQIHFAQRKLEQFTQEPFEYFVQEQPGQVTQGPLGDSARRVLKQQGRKELQNQLARKSKTLLKQPGKLPRAIGQKSKGQWEQQQTSLNAAQNKRQRKSLYDEIQIFNQWAPMQNDLQQPYDSIDFIEISESSLQGYQKSSRQTYRKASKQTSRKTPRQISHKASRQFGRGPQGLPVQFAQGPPKDVARGQTGLVAPGQVEQKRPVYFEGTLTKLIGQSPQIQFSEDKTSPAQHNTPRKSEQRQNGPFHQFGSPEQLKSHAMFNQYEEISGRFGHGQLEEIGQSHEHHRQYHVGSQGSQGFKQNGIAQFYEVYVSDSTDKQKQYKWITPVQNTLITADDNNQEPSFVQWTQIQNESSTTAQNEGNNEISLESGTQEKGCDRIAIQNNDQIMENHEEDCIYILSEDIQVGQNIEVISEADGTIKRYQITKEMIVEEEVMESGEVTYVPTFPTDDNM